MSTAVAYAVGGLEVARRDVRLLLSYRGRILSQLAAPLVNVVLFYYISRLVAFGEFSTSDAYFAYVVVGIAMLQVLASTIQLLPNALRQELVAGTFERIVLSSFGAAAGVISIAVFPLCFAVLRAAVTIGFAAAVFGMPVSWTTIAVAVPVAVLGAVALLPFAVLFAAGVLAIKQAGAGAGLVVTALSIAGGIFFPVALLPDWIEWTSHVQPLTPSLDLLRHLIIGVPLQEAAWISVGKLVGFVLIFLPVAVWVLRTAISISQRRGTIIEY